MTGSGAPAFRPHPTTAPAPSAWVRGFAAEHGLRVAACAWVNGIGGITWQLEGPDGLGRALHTFHDAVPVDECPWDGSDEGTARLEPGEAVVCHGDACIPNLLLAEVDGRLEPSGYVDVAACAVASRWADLAAATLSLGWNLPGDAEAHTARFLTAYGIGVDLPAQPGRLAEHQARRLGLRRS